MLVLYLVVFFDRDPQSRSNDLLPKGAGWTLDAISLTILIQAEWYATAIAYACSAIVLEINYRRARKLSTKPNQ